MCEGTFYLLEVTESWDHEADIYTDVLGNVFNIGDGAIIETKPNYYI